MFESFRDRKANKAPPQYAPTEARRRVLQAQQAPAQSAAQEGKTVPGSEASRPSAVLSPHLPNPVARQLEMVARRSAHMSENSKAEAEIAASKEGQKLVVGPRIRLKGEVSNCDMLVIEGHFEGTAKSRVLQVAPGGSFQGDAEVERAEMSGKFEGALTVSNRLIIRGSGRVSGTIQYFGIEVEEGGQISGNIQVVQHEASGNRVAQTASQEDTGIRIGGEAAS